MIANVVYLGAHSRMTPKEALSVAEQKEWTEVVICGYEKDDPRLVVLSSHMTRENALWLMEHCKLYIMDRL